MRTLTRTSGLPSSEALWSRMPPHYENWRQSSTRQPPGRPFSFTAFISSRQDCVLKLDGRLFTRSRSKYTDHVPQRLEPTAKIYVRLLFDGMDRVVTAQLDTGAAWSILGSEVSERM